MLPRHEITKSLPPPHDDEPPSLRHDITDEILDHLDCGLRRELLRNGGDESAARRQVLNKFGNPDQVARRLWFQAMRNKLMVQKLLTGSMVGSMIATVVMVGWMLHQQQLTNAALLEHLTRQADAAKETVVARDTRWNSLKIKVTLQDTDNAPAIGYRVSVERSKRVNTDTSVSESAGQWKDWSEIDNEAGIYDCGYVEPGIYQARVWTPWNEDSIHEFTVHPGEEHLEQIVAPRTPPHFKTGFLKIQVDNKPNTKPPKGMMLLLSFSASRYREIGKDQWSMFAGRGSMVGVVMYVSSTGQTWSCQPSDFQRESFPWLGKSDDQKLGALKTSAWRPVNEWPIVEGKCHLMYCIFGLTNDLTPNEASWQDLEIDFESMKDPSRNSTQIGLITKFETSIEVTIDSSQTNTVTLPVPPDLFQRDDKTPENSK